MYNREIIDVPIAEDCESCKRLRTWAELSRSMGYVAGYETNAQLLKQAQSALKEEQEGRLKDNHVLTEEISRLEEVIRDLELRVKDSERR